MFRSALSAALLSLVAPSLAAGEAPVPMSVVKQASCGCCAAWVQRMRAAGFAVSIRDVDRDTLIATKQAAGLGPDRWSCHTARVEGYVIEGHVPAGDIRRLLRARAEAIGLAVPGMPVGAPGMEYGDAREPFEVLLVRADGSAETFSSYPGN